MQKLRTVAIFFLVNLCSRCYRARNAVLDSGFLAFIVFGKRLANHSAYQSVDFRYMRLTTTFLNILMINEFSALTLVCSYHN